MAVIGPIFTTFTLATQLPVIKTPTPMLNDDPRHRVQLIRDQTGTDGRTNVVCTYGTVFLTTKRLLREWRLKREHKAATVAYCRDTAM